MPHSSLRSYAAFCATLPLLGCGTIDIGSQDKGPSDGGGAYDAATADVVVVTEGGVCTPDPPGTVITGTGGGQASAPYCPWNGCLDGPKASCGSDRQWHCPAPPPPCCYSLGTSDRIPCDDAGPTCKPGIAPQRPQAQACSANPTDGGPVDTGCGSAIPHDECLVDRDCGATGICVCAAPWPTGCGVPPILGNFCIPSNCRIDSDCVPCGACRPALSCNTVSGYHCATPNDDCSENADCAALGPKAVCDFQNGRWTCVADLPCPG